MSFKYHEPCPRCGSKDNRAVYDDGHTWCFGCSKWTPPDGMSMKYLEHQLNQQVKGVGGIEFPPDFTPHIPKEALKWIKQYGITNEELSNNHIGWSNSRSMLIFPFYGDKDELQIWQGRYFPKQNPKVFTEGERERFILLPSITSKLEDDSRLVVVEDPVSSIKVSRYVRCSPLMGASLSQQKAIRIAKEYSHLSIWLDFDKIDMMMKFTEMYRSLFDNIDFIVTEKDPKDLTDNDIKEKLDG